MGRQERAATTALVTFASPRSPENHITRNRADRSKAQSSDPAFPPERAHPPHFSLAESIPPAEEHRTADDLSYPECCGLRCKFSRSERCLRQNEADYDRPPVYLLELRE